MASDILASAIGGLVDDSLCRFGRMWKHAGPNLSRR
jgi:hypothetical protein